jgi:hypothetical protein
LLEGLEGLEAAQGAEAVSLWVAVMQNSLSALAGRPESVTQMSEREAQVFREGGPAGRHSYRSTSKNPEKFSNRRSEKDG